MNWEIIPILLVTPVITTLATIFLAEGKLRRDCRLEFVAERITRELLLDKRWRLRSFSVINDHLGGFDDELQRILVRAG